MERPGRAGRRQVCRREVCANHPDHAGNWCSSSRARAGGRGGGALPEVSAPAGEERTRRAADGDGVRHIHVTGGVSSWSMRRTSSRSVAHLARQRWLGLRTGHGRGQDRRHAPAHHERAARQGRRSHQRASLDNRRSNLRICTRARTCGTRGRGAGPPGSKASSGIPTGANGERAFIGTARASGWGTLPTRSKRPGRTIGPPESCSGRSHT